MNKAKLLEEEKNQQFTTDYPRNSSPKQSTINDDDSDYIEEDIGNNRGYRDYDLYQVPVSGGLPIKMVALDVQKRPFTPPFAQLIKVSHSSVNQSSGGNHHQSGSSTANTQRD